MVAGHRDPGAVIRLDSVSTPYRVILSNCPCNLVFDYPDRVFGNVRRFSRPCAAVEIGEAPRLHLAESEVVRYGNGAARPHWPATIIEVDSTDGASGCEPFLESQFMPSMRLAPEIFHTRHCFAA